LAGSSASTGKVGGSVSDGLSGGGVSLLPEPHVSAFGQIEQPESNAAATPTAIRVRVERMEEEAGVCACTVVMWRLLSD
jgi:hypothetical protein